MSLFTVPLPYCSLPVKISDVPIANEETSIYIKCHDRLFSNVSILDDKGEELFHGSAPPVSKSRSWRREVKDTKGVKIFDLRHLNWGMSNHWTVERGEETNKQHLADLKRIPGSHKSQSEIDMVMSNGRGEVDNVVLEMRKKDKTAIKCGVFYENACIAEVILEGSNDVVDSSEKDRSSWRIRIAGGVDPGVILILALCRAEQHHTWRE